ncbi:hypothetical protein Q0Z83_090230 [Actinoplanes sichuanensis]|uniref:Uncharacterized protein n=1 Tax=Actinoplanes sichuanensis TaxID=512349 RepID=A0ABW4AKH6_9ACTN|nr:hypothetical protein [Actinoplanes sichuanensis]BEL10832.1 hypothetical protein Q0Z83_090230 [Actinoplanes sichuanensis]
MHQRTLRWAAGLCAAATVLLGSPAQADTWDEPGATGGQVSAAQVEALALTAKPCASGGATDADADVASAVRPDMNGPRMGSAVNAYRISCARAITKAVYSAGLTERAAVIAVTTAITETTLNNWNGGDRDSVGLFQQRPSQGWGDADDLIKPAYATKQFLNAMIRKYPNDAWKSGDIGAICQKVQVSAVPDAYAREVHDARLIVDKLWPPSQPPSSEPLPRIGVLITNGTALVKEGSLSAGWVNEYSGVQQVVVDGDRVGVLTTDGRALVKEGGLSAGWTTQYTGVKQLALAGDRIGVLTTAGTALVKQGGLSAAWVNEYSGVRQIALAGNRIGVLTTAGVALVKQGGLSAGWVTEYSSVQELALSGDRIGVLTTAGVALVKDGGLSAGWVTEYSSVQQIALAGDRIGVLTTAGTALVKQGGLSAGWVTEYGNVRQIALAGDRIGVLTGTGVALVKDGGLSASWINEYTGVQQLALS